MTFTMCYGLLDYLEDTHYENPLWLSFRNQGSYPTWNQHPFTADQKFWQVKQSWGLRANLNLLEEAREIAVIRMAAYQWRVACYHNIRVKDKQFKVGDLVLCRAEVSQLTDQVKLSLNLEGPYQVEEVIRVGTCRIKQLDGTPISRPWNSSNLRMYYQQHVCSFFNKVNLFF